MTSLLFCDGFDKYGPTGNQAMGVGITNGDWNNVTGASIVSPLSVNGFAVQLTSAATFESSNFTSVGRIVGSVRLNIQSNTTGSGQIAFRAGTTAVFTLELSQTNGLRIRTGSSLGAIINSVGGIFGFTTFVLSWDVTIGASSPYAIYVDGSLFLSGSGNTGNAQTSVNNIRLTAGSSSCSFDDLILYNPADSAYNNAVLTNRAVVETQFPNSDTQTQFINDGDILVPAGMRGTGVYRDSVSLTGSAPGANFLFLVRVVAPINTTLTAVAMLPGSTGAATKNKAIVYSDSSGNPGSLLSDGVEVIGTTANVILVGALVTPQAVIEGTAYWIGFYTDTSYSMWRYDTVTNLAQKKANTYASGAPVGPLTGMTTGQNMWTIWGLCQGSLVNWVALGRNPFLPNAQSQVRSLTVGQEDLFGFPPLVTTPSGIYGGMVKIFTSKTDSGTRTVNLNMKSGASDSAGSAPNQQVSVTKQWQSSTFDVDPATGVPWTASGVNNAKSGYSVAS